jgi:hypothetical protein
MCVSSVCLAILRRDEWNAKREESFLEFSSAVITIIVVTNVKRLLPPLTNSTQAPRMPEYGKKKKKRKKKKKERKVQQFREAA